MATAILSSGSSLNHRFDHKTLIHPNHSRLCLHSYAFTTAPRHLKRRPTSSLNHRFDHKTLIHPNHSRKMVVSPTVKTNLVMGQVKILKRGETLNQRLCRSRSERSSPDATPVLVAQLLLLQALFLFHVSWRTSYLLSKIQETLKKLLTTISL